MTLTPEELAKIEARVRAVEPWCTQVENIWAICNEDAPALIAALKEARAVLTWYGEQARLCRLIHSEGDIGRQALRDDGGNRARAALTGEKL